MEKEYYSPNVKAYEPMAQNTVSNIVIDYTHTLKSGLAENCRKYTPTNDSSNFYQPGYSTEIIREETSHSGMKQLKSKEKRVMFYQPGRESLKRTGGDYTITVKIFRGESLFSKVITNVLKTITRWFSRVKR